MTGSIVFADHWSKEFRILRRILDNLENLTLTTQYQRVVVPRVILMWQLRQSQLHLPDLISDHDVIQLLTDEFGEFPYWQLPSVPRSSIASRYSPEDSRQHQFIRILYPTLTHPWHNLLLPSTISSAISSAPIINHEQFKTFQIILMQIMFFMILPI